MERWLDRDLELKFDLFNFNGVTSVNGVTGNLPTGSSTVSGAQNSAQIHKLFQDAILGHDEWKEPVFLDKKDEGCSHEWVDYTGLFEVYKFCKKCDLKA